jgi:hypothetical protein
MGDRALALGLAGFLLAAAHAAGIAAERTPTADVFIDGSVPLNFTDDRYGNPQGHADYLTSPYLRMSLNGRLVPSLHYALYASGGFDKYPSRADADSTFATLGASLTKRWGDFRLGFSLERNHAYDGVFGPFLYVAHDLGSYVSYLYTDAAKVVRIKPAVSLSRRFSEDASQESYVASFKVDLERKLADRWWVTPTPRIRYQNFLGGENLGREDTIYSISTGLRYSINDNIGVSSSVGWERRTSNVPGRNFDSFGAGISLDFSHTFGMPDDDTFDKRRRR